MGPEEKLDDVRVIHDNPHNEENQSQSVVDTLVDTGNTASFIDEVTDLAGSAVETVADVAESVASGVSGFIKDLFD